MKLYDGSLKREKLVWLVTASPLQIMCRHDILIQTEMKTCLKHNDKEKKMSDDFTQNDNVTKPQDNSYQPQDYSQPQDNSYQNQGNSQQDNPYQDYSQPQNDSYQNQGYTQQNNPYQNQGYGRQNNPYQNQGYGGQQGNSYQQYNSQYYGTASQKGDGIGFGITSLVLGVLSIFLFACCVNYILAVLAIVFGIIQLVKNNQKGLAIAGIITASISIIVGTIFWVYAVDNIENGNIPRYYNNQDDDFFEDFLEEYRNELQDNEF